MTHPYPYLVDEPEDMHVSDALWVPRNEELDTPEKAIAYARAAYERDSYAGVWEEILEGRELACGGSEWLLPYQVVEDDEATGHQVERVGVDVDFQDEYVRFRDCEPGTPGAHEWWVVRLDES